MLKLTDYGHKLIYPWLAHLYVLIRLKIAGKLKDENGQQMLAGAIEDFLRISSVHYSNGGFFEVLEPESLKPVIHKLMKIPVFRSSAGFLGSVSTYLAVVDEFTKLGIDLSQL